MPLPLGSARSRGRAVSSCVGRGDRVRLRRRSCDRAAVVAGLVAAKPLVGVRRRRVRPRPLDRRQRLPDARRPRDRRRAGVRRRVRGGDRPDRVARVRRAALGVARGHAGVDRVAGVLRPEPVPVRGRARDRLAVRLAGVVAAEPLVREARRLVRPRRRSRPSASSRPPSCRRSAARRSDAARRRSAPVRTRRRRRGRRPPRALTSSERLNRMGHSGSSSKSMGCPLYPGSSASEPALRNPLGFRPMPEQLWAPWRLEYVRQADEAPGCIFCVAAAGDDEEMLVVARGTLAFVLLNRYPYASGHLMVAPLRHVGDFLDLVGRGGGRAARADARPRSPRSRGRSGRTASTSAGTSAAPRAPASSTTCTSTSSRAGAATRTSCRCSPT